MGKQIRHVQLTMDCYMRGVLFLKGEPLIALATTHTHVLVFKKGLDGHSGNDLAVVPKKYKGQCWWILKEEVTDIVPVVLENK